MEFLTIFGVLTRHRVLIAVGAVLSLLVAITAAGMLPFGPSARTSPPKGTAQTRVLVDHDRTVLANTAENADTVGTQAALLAEVMAGDEQRNAIARRAGIPRAKLGMQRLQLTQLVALGELPRRAGQAAGTIARPYVVNVWAASPLPVLTLDVTAPSAAKAARVARAARDTLAALVAARAPSAERAIAIKPLGEVRAIELPAATRSKILGPAAAITFFVFWLCCIVIVTGLRRAWHNATVRAAPSRAG